MNKYIKKIATFSVLLLAFIGGCSLFDKDTIIETVKTTVRVDTVYNTVTDTIYKTQPTKVVEILVYDTIIRTRTDTIELIRDFFTKKLYVDTIVMGENGYVVIEDTVYRNDIISRKSIYKIKFPNITVTNTTEKTLEYKPSRFRAFVFGDHSMSDNNDWFRPLRVGGGLQYAIKEGHYLGATGDLMNQDIIATYDFNSKRMNIGAEYSIGEKYLNLSAKYWIIK